MKASIETQLPIVQLALSLSLMLSFATVAIVSTPAAAVAWGSGDYGEGCCSVPPELIGRASALEQSFSGSSAVELARQSWAGQICQYHPCEDEVSEDQARELLRNFFDRQQRAQDLARADRDRTVTWVGVIIAALSAFIAGGGLMVSFMALRQSGSNERDIGQLQGRMSTEATDETHT